MKTNLNRYFNFFRALVFRAHFFSGFLIIFFGRFLQKEKTVKRFVNKQLALAKTLSKLNGKKLKVAAMAYLNDYNAALSLSDYQIKCKL